MEIVCVCNIYADERMKNAHTCRGQRRKQCGTLPRDRDRSGRKGIALFIGLVRRIQRWRPVCKIECIVL
jgi:hypothetical protein